MHTLLLVLLSFLSNAKAGATLQPSPLSDEAYAETYTAVASLDGGAFVLVQMLFTNAGIGDRKGACRALWVAPGASGVNASTSVGSDEWSYDAGSDTLTVGPCTLGTNGDRLRFYVKLPELSVDLWIDGKAKSTRPPGHRVDVQGSFYFSDILLPSGSAQASITRSGKTTKLQGAAHLDHSRSNALLPKVSACWLRFRGLNGATPILLQARVPARGVTHVGWSWSTTQGSPKAAASITLGSQTVGSTTLTVDGIKVTPTSQIYRYRPTASYGMLGKLAAPWIGDPTTTTYNAKATTPAGATVTGVLEVSEIESGGCSS